MDAFEIRMQFLGILRKLKSSVNSIQKVVAFCLRYGDKFADDLWDCILEECERASLNSRINIFYALDSLLEESINSGFRIYSASLNRDLQHIVDLVVPHTREGIPNLMSVKQVLSAWKTKRFLDFEVIDKVEGKLDQLHVSDSSSARTQGFSRQDILQRIADDRERVSSPLSQMQNIYSNFRLPKHKRLRERIWVLPIPSVVDPLTRLAISMPSPSYEPQSTGSVSLNDEKLPMPAKSSAPSTSLPIDFEFDQQWELSQSEELTQEDFDSMRTESERCFGCTFS